VLSFCFCRDVNGSTERVSMEHGLLLRFWHIRSYIPKALYSISWCKHAWPFHPICLSASTRVGTFSCARSFRNGFDPRFCRLLYFTAPTIPANNSSADSSNGYIDSTLLGQCDGSTVVTFMNMSHKCWRRNDENSRVRSLLSCHSHSENLRFANVYILIFTRKNVWSQS